MTHNISAGNISTPDEDGSVHQPQRSLPPPEPPSLPLRRRRVRPATTQTSEMRRGVSAPATAARCSSGNEAPPVATSDRNAVPRDPATTGRCPPPPSPHAGHLSPAPPPSPTVSPRPAPSALPTPGRVSAAAPRASAPRRRSACPRPGQCAGRRSSAAPQRRPSQSAPGLRGGGAVISPPPRPPAGARLSPGAAPVRKSGRAPPLLLEPGRAPRRLEAGGGGVVALDEVKRRLLLLRWGRPAGREGVACSVVHQLSQPLGHDDEVVVSGETSQAGVWTAPVIPVPPQVGLKRVAGLVHLVELEAR